MDRTIFAVSRLVALFFAALFVVAAALFLTAFIARRQLLRPAPYKEALRQVNAYERAPQILSGILADTLNDSQERDSAAGLFLNLSPSDYEIMLNQLLPEQWLERQVEAIIDQSFAGMEGGNPGSPITISLLAIKDNLRGQAGSQALLAVIETRPTCAPGDLRTLTCGIDVQSGISCQPPAAQLQLCATALNAVLVGTTSLIPDTVEFSTLLQAVQPVAQSVSDVLHPYNLVLRPVARFGWIFLPVFLLLLTLFAVRSLRDWLRWWGLSVLGVGIVLLPVALLTWLSPAWFFAGPIGELRSWQPALGQLAADVVSVLGRRMALQLAFAAGGLGALGVIMGLISFLLPARQR